MAMAVVKEKKKKQRCKRRSDWHILAILYILPTLIANRGVTLRRSLHFYAIREALDCPTIATFLVIIWISILEY